MNKFLTIIVLLFSFVITNAQTSFEQGLFNNNIRLIVKKSATEYNFLDKDDKRIGGKKIVKTGVQYLDKRYRIIHEVKNVAKTTTNQPAITKPRTQAARSNSIERKRRRTIIYDAQGNKLWVIKRRINGNIYYKDSGNKTVGYKEINGTKIVYRDSRHRITGESNLIGGNWVYFRHKTRSTPIIMINQTLDP